MKNRILRVFGGIIIIAGVLIFLFPDIQTYWVKEQSQKVIREYQQERQYDDAVQAADSMEEDPLFREIKAYNQTIFENGQEDFSDAWAVTQSPQVLRGFEQDVFGYIEIPAMDVKLPLYVGASEEHMKKGAAILGSTSLPIGGANTNSVIAGHRGYQGIPFFREIERLQKGDQVIITNPWEVRTYQVDEIAVIMPDDTNAVLIQEGRELITLLTCHPYRSNGKYRYVVYCVPAGDTQETDVIDTKMNVEESDMVFESSASDILIEQYVRRGGALVLAILVVWIAVKKASHKKRRR